MTDLAVFILRLAIGVVFSGHGLQKAFGLFGGPGINAFSGMLSGLGFAPALLWAYAVAYIELIAGVFLIAGLFTRVSSLLLIIIMVVAAVKVHLRNGFFLQNGGFEYIFVLTCALLAILINGAGSFSFSKK
ncbi:MAG: DoxX family protein [Candidatus Omnitrophota bacterium]|jgi:putative oxidoreductase